MALPTDFGGMHSGGMGFMGYGWIIQVVIFILFFLVVFWLLKNQQNGTKTVSNETPQQILKRRLASGEISKKEYHDLMKEISEPKPKKK
ncbi:SHOCT domain-containing protein [Candidatus Woesearchaeota archaeon]|nr:SHOCT domain-containing protein [Candidatus Woesearchaeota archaeon]MCF7901025.1 SHOCT domain-containing protein [Candidatus Woesearchaeota archaeon]MCF8013394.1 SHOCT domain-containing protein [Candidatus Woesearchaeota archaeon]